MGFFDFLKKKELEEISSLREQLKRYECISNLEDEQQYIKSQIAICGETLGKLENDCSSLEEKIKLKESQIVELNDVILLQEYGMYQPIYEFASSELYAAELEKLREQQKQMIKKGEAATCNIKWEVHGSAKDGARMIKELTKLILRCFNDECDNLINKVKFNNIVSFEDKIQKSYGIINNLGSSLNIYISHSYFKLKIKELHLAYEYAVKKQEEKDEQKRIREQMREEAKLQKEIEEARKDIEKEQKHYANALIKLNKQLETSSDIERDALLEKKAEIESHLEQLDTSLKDIDYREANKKAGYVYIISNIGSFGENVYKIGMTRRLDPYERVDELGDASVPFKFDVHAMIFSEDAPKLETALHHAFEDKKVNMVNQKREFFNVTLDEIEQVIKANYDKTVEFTRVPEAEQYRETTKIKTLAKS
jgi:chromosome segregation ATPase